MCIHLSQPSDRINTASDFQTTKPVVDHSSTTQHKRTHHQLKFPSLLHEFKKQNVIMLSEIFNVNMPWSLYFKSQHQPQTKSWQPWSCYLYFFRETFLSNYDILILTTKNHSSNWTFNSAYFRLLASNLTFRRDLRNLSTVIESEQKAAIGESFTSDKGRTFEQLIHNSDFFIFYDVMPTFSPHVGRI